MLLPASQNPSSSEITMADEEKVNYHGRTSGINAASGSQ
jgi:hypothetical protein